eukprot:COSAG01_NODE_3603_length_5885_cov_6.630315_8_plen_105_part_00
MIKNYPLRKLTRPCRRGAPVASATVLPIAAAAVPRRRAHRVEGVEGFNLSVLSGGCRAAGAAVPCHVLRPRGEDPFDMTLRTTPPAITRHTGRDVADNPGRLRS